MHWHARTSDVHAALPKYFAGEPLAPLLPTWKVKVTNTGKMVSDVVVLCFVTSSRPGAPLKQLAAFERAAAIPPGGHTVASLSPIPTALTAVNAAGTESILAESYAVSCGGMPDGTVNGTLVVQGDPVEIFRMPDA